MNGRRLAVAPATIWLYSTGMDYRDGTILLHTCCGPCGAPAVERLLQQKKDVLLFFSNSNIFPEEEFERRMEAARVMAAHFNVPLIIDRYDHLSWREAVQGYEHEPEKGRRCARCFAYSLTRTAAQAEKIGIMAFSTTLTLSPHKSSPLIFSIGERFPGFLSENFKKRDGFRRSVELSGELDLYRQDYCGCEFSMR